MLTGDAETTTEPGIYLVQVKQEDYYSRKYQTPMPYSIFFNYTQREPRFTEAKYRHRRLKIRLCHPWLYPRERSPKLSGYMIGRSQAGPRWLSAVGERRIKDSYQFSDCSFRLKGISFEKMAEGKVPRAF